MKRTTFILLLAGFVSCLVPGENLAQRGRGFGGGGARFGGGGFGGGFTAPAFSSIPEGRSSFAGERGGFGETARGSGSYTTQRGGTINYGGIGFGGTTAGGISGGRYLGGVNITTAGGQTINHVGTGGGAIGPGGYAVGGRAGATGTTGPLGTGATASRGAFAAGPGGAEAFRSGVAVGPNGAAAYRGGAAATSTGTYYRSAAAVTGQGVYVRSGFAAQYPALAARWAGFTYRPIAWSALAGYCGYPADTATSYDYGSSVTYQDDGVYVNGQNVGSAQQYSQQASDIAASGQNAPQGTDADWKPLGVYAMVMGEEKTSYNIFQLSINTGGALKGSYYNALTDTTDPVTGAVDKATQRAAWTVAGKKTPVYEAGIVNLTEDQTTMMVHYSKDRSRQFSLVRIKQPDDAPPPAK